MGQQGADVLHFPAIEFAEVRVELEDWDGICLCQLALKVTFARLKLLELRADTARVTITFEDEG
ncbi:hypothetical protein C0V75_20905 [Tabrizicola sp. TH137]|nr:hypothetical protein C0V75_20905 [Tabrizicola sp. TH137]